MEACETVDTCTSPLATFRSDVCARAWHGSGGPNTCAQAERAHRDRRPATAHACDKRVQPAMPCTCCADGEPSRRSCAAEDVSVSMAIGGALILLGLLAVTYGRAHDLRKQLACVADPETDEHISIRGHPHVRRDGSVNSESEQYAT